MTYPELWNEYIDIVFSNLDLNEVSSQSNQKKDISIISKTYAGKNYIKSRETLIYSNNISIYNNIIYPKTGKNLPCFGMDLMAFMENKVIIVFDFQHPKEHYDFNDELVEKHLNSYKDNTKQIRFFEPGNHFSRYIFVRKCNIHEVNQYIGDFKKYIVCYKELVETLNPSESNTKEYVDFDSYMYKLDPVGGFMKSKFGEEFAEKYVKDFLFPYAKYD
jgi:hypothetical protein